MLSPLHRLPLPTRLMIPVDIPQATMLQRLHRLLDHSRDEELLSSMMMMTMTSAADVDFPVSTNTKPEHPPEDLHYRLRVEELLLLIHRPSQPLHYCVATTTTLMARNELRRRHSFGSIGATREFRRREFYHRQWWVNKMIGWRRTLRRSGVDQ